MPFSGHNFPSLCTSTGVTAGNSYCRLCVVYTALRYGQRGYSCVTGYVAAGVPAYYITRKRTVSPEEGRIRI